MYSEFLLEMDTLSLKFIKWKKGYYVEEKIYKIVVLTNMYEKWSVSQT